MNILHIRYRFSPTRLRRGWLMRMTTAAVQISFVAAVAVAADDDAAAAGQEADAPARQLLDRLFSERAELLSGEYTATGRTVRRFSPKFEETKGDIAVDCAFDYVRGLLRWEREEPRLFLDRDAPDKPGTVRQVGYRLIKTPEKSYAQDLSSGLDTIHIIAIVPPNFVVPKNNLGVPYDVRTFGLNGWGSVDSGATLEELKSRFAKYLDIQLKELGDGQTELRCTVGEGTRQPWRMEATWRIDTAHGDVVTYSQLDQFDGTKNLWTKGIEKTEVTWEERNSVWVPTALLLERNFNGVETYEIQLEWESVNEELSDDEFEPEALHVPPRTAIADTRLDKPIIVGEIEPRDESTAPLAPGHAFDTLQRYWTVALAAVLVLLGAWGLWLWRWKISRAG